MKIKRLLITAMLLLIQAGACNGEPAIFSTTSDLPVELVFPVSCQLEQDCWLINYPDIDLTEGIKDYNGGKFTYDGGLGTEIAIQSLIPMEKGVNVVAAQDGTVIYATNHLEDNLPLKRGVNINEQPFCGNSVVIKHSDRWETVYCHLKKGSVAVKKGDFVRRGNKIAEIGASGKTDIPHLYFAVLGDGLCFDPFSGQLLSESKEGEKKTETKQYKSFWKPTVKKKLPYRDVAVVNVGIATQDPTPDRVKEGKYQDVEIKIDTNSIVLWMYGFHFQKGDSIKVNLQSPSGKRIFSAIKMINADTPEKLIFFRVPKPSSDWQTGIYNGSFEFTRTGLNLLYEYNTRFEVKEPPVSVDEEALKRKKWIKERARQKKQKYRLLKKLYNEDRLPDKFKDREELIKRLKGTTE